MDIVADENAGPSTFERVLRHLETRVPDCSLTILSRALLITTVGEANELQGLLALSSLDLAHRAIQSSAQAGILQHWHSILQQSAWDSHLGWA